MDAKTSTDQLGVSASILCKSAGKLDNKFADMETDNIANLSSSPSILDNKGSALSPITPDSNREGSDFMSAFISPFSIGSNSHMLHNGDNIYMNEDDDCPSTPKAGVFDPFAPGSDDLLMAPVSMKYLEESRTYVARRLNFTSLVTKNIYEKGEGVCESALDDDMLLEAVYKSLLEAIVSKQAEDIISEISASHDALTTPPSAPRLTGIAETCPGAPFKHVKKSRNIDLGLCRRLAFDF